MRSRRAPFKLPIENPISSPTYYTITPRKLRFFTAPIHKNHLLPPLKKFTPTHFELISPYSIRTKDFQTIFPNRTPPRQNFFVPDQPKLSLRSVYPPAHTRGRLPVMLHKDVACGP